MPSRKRGHDEVDQSETAPEVSLLHRVRNSWQFASLMQYIQIFGTAAKISEEVDIDMLEEECLKVPHSEKLTEIGLCMLRMVSSHRGLTPEIFDEYTRRQYVAKAPHRNPFGEEEEPVKFADMDIMERLNVLHQLSVWTFFNEDRMRDRMPEKDSSEQCVNWRLDPVGWDAEDRQYYVLDDNRLYRMTPPPLPPSPKAKPSSKKKKKAPPPRPKGSRSSKRQRLLNGVDDEEDEEMSFLDAKDDDDDKSEALQGEPEDNGLAGAKWELLAITNEEYRDALESFKKSRDPNEKAMYKYYEREILPALERVAASQARRAAARQRELEAMAKMANAKRSSRISSRQQQQREAEEAMLTERKKKEELAEAQREQQRQLKMEVDRESRMMTREQRLKDREMKRILHEAEVERLRADSEMSEGAEARVSERNRKAKLEKSQAELDQLKEEEEDWDFDCSVCGVHGRNLDDGTHSMACEKCGVWQHSACHGISAEKAESDDFHFTCAACSKPKPKPEPTPTAVPTETDSKTLGAHSNGHNAQQAQSKTPVQNGYPQWAPPTLPPPQQYPNGFQAQSNGIYAPSLHAPQAFQQGQGAPRWQAPPSPSKPITPRHPQPDHDRSRIAPQSSASQRTPSFENAQTGSSGSPTPLLSATQGSTTVRFSPTQPQNGVFGGSSQAYTPTSNRPNVAAYSPTKKEGSSPPQPQVAKLGAPAGGSDVERSSPYALNAGPMGQAPSSKASVLPSASTGISPVKHDLSSSPGPPLPPQSSASGLGITSSFPAALSQSTTSPSLNAQRSMEPLGMETAPTLSPSVNMAAANANPPVKRSSPKMPSLPTPHLGISPIFAGTSENVSPSRSNEHLRSPSRPS